MPATALKTRIAFLALDDIHHLHHILPIAFELSEDLQYQCVIYLQPHSQLLTQKIAALYPRHRCEMRILSLNPLRRAIRFWRRGIVPARRLIRQQSKELCDYDAIVTPDMNLKELMEYARKNKPHPPKFFLTFHGGGSRERPYQLLMNYDGVFLCGEHRQKEFEQAGYLKKIRFAVTGYPKFDKIPVDFRPQLFENDKPVVLYNPHFDLKISSWAPWGLEILEHFYRQDRFNFIFAPHCNLFQKHVSSRQIPKKYFSARHLIIDLGSEKSVDMTYTQAADIYIGDVSSQVFEFLRRPRPCFFLNPFQVPHEQYRAWRCGPVIETLPALLSALESSSAIDNSFETTQKSCFEETFSITQEPAATRIATMIKKSLQG